MFVLFATIKIKPEHHDAFITACIPDAEGSLHHEPGCVRFDLLEDQSDANTFYLYEAYEDQAAFDFHNTTPHFTRWHDTVADWFVEPPHVVFTRSLFPEETIWWKIKALLK